MKISAVTDFHTNDVLNVVLLLTTLAKAMVSPHPYKKANKY